MKKMIPLIIAIAIVVGALSFYGGFVYGRSSSKNIGRNNIPSVNGANFTGKANSNGGLVSGEIISIDANSATIKLSGSGSKIILINESTAISKTIDAAIKDLSAGVNITASGTTNTDGSITAKTIQISSATANSGAGAANQAPTGQDQTNTQNK